MTTEECQALKLVRRCATSLKAFQQGRMGCFSLCSSQHRHEQEADLVMKSLELMRSSESVSVFPSLRLIYGAGSAKGSASQQSAPTTSKVHPCSLSDTSWSNRGSSVKWEPLFLLIEKGKFTGKPLPLPEPPRSEEDENFLVPPLMPQTASPLTIAPDAWGVKLKCFRYEELAAACEEYSARCCIREGSFGKVYKCIMHVRSSRSIGKRKMEVAVFRLLCSFQEVEDWIIKVKWIARLQHPNVCRLIGFCASGPRKDGRAERLLVFEHCDYGGLDVLLAKSQYIRPLSWSTRLKIAFGAAKGLAYLHDNCQHQVLYTNLTAASILIDKDFNAKLSDYGLNVEAIIPKMSELQLSFTRNDVRNFGVILMELLVGSKNMRRLVEKGSKWTSRLLRDENKLYHNLDSELRNEPLALMSMKSLAALALRCLRKDSQQRPSMNEVAEELEVLLGSHKVALSNLDMNQVC